MVCVLQWLNSNAGAVQAVVALVALVFTGWLVWVASRQRRISEEQSSISKEQHALQERLAAWEFSPLVIGLFQARRKDGSKAIALENAGRGPALDIRVDLARAHPEAYHERALVGADQLAPGAKTEAWVGRAKTPPDVGVPGYDEANDMWVVHYKDIFGRTWHTTSNVAEEGIAPLGRFRIWAPGTEPPIVCETLCWVCLDEPVQARALRDLAGGRGAAGTGR